LQIAGHSFMNITCSRDRGKVVGMIAMLCKLVHAKHAFDSTVCCNNPAAVVHRWGPLLRSLGCAVEPDGRVAYDGCAPAEASYVLKTATSEEKLTYNQWTALCAQDNPIWARVPFEVVAGDEPIAHSRALVVRVYMPAV
jgi:hypothetical protein